MKKQLARLAGIVLLTAYAGVGLAQTAPIKLRFGHAHADSDSQHVAALEFAKRVKERTKGGIEIQVFGNNQLGNDGAMIAGVRGGTIDMETSGNPFFTGMVPKLNVFDLPYLFDNAQQAYKALDSDVGRSLLDELGNHQLKGLAFWEVGFRSLANNKRAVNQPADIKGLKLRTTPNPAHIKAFQLLGANPQPMPFGEVFAALESGAIDGHENPPSLMLSSKMYEVQKNLSLTNHAYTALIVVMNKKRFDSLTPENQKILLEEAANAAKFQRELNAKGEQAAVNTLREKGMKIVEAPDRAAIRAIVREPTRQLFIEKNGDDVLKQIEAIAK